MIQKRLSKFPMVQKTIALSLVFFFTVSNLGVASTTLSINTASEVKLQSLASRIEIPEVYGSVVERFLSPSASYGVIIHIQDAHASLEAQDHIRKTLHYLKDQYALDFVTVEGAAEELNANKLNTFKDASLNQDLAELLVKRGVLSGTERFLLDETLASSKARIFGIENADLYGKNLGELQTVLNEKIESKKFLDALRVSILTEGSRELNPKLQKFFREWVLFQDRPSEIIRHLGILKKFAESELHINLVNADSQVDWPHLTRVYRLTALESLIDLNAAASELRLLQQWIRDQKVSGSAAVAVAGYNLEKGFLRNSSSSIRGLLEEFYNAAKHAGFRFERYPALSKVWGRMILSEEIDAVLMFDEVTKLTNELLTSLSTTPQEKKIIQSYQNYVLLSKTLNLELTDADYRRVLSEGIAMRPSKIAEGIEALKDLTVQGRIDPLFDSALSFYQDAKNRDQVMFGNMLLQMKKARKSHAVLITGGFHTEGLSHLIKQQGFSYLEIQPRIGDLSQQADYEKAMLLKGLPHAVQKSQKAIGSVASFPRALTSGQAPSSFATYANRVFRFSRSEIVARDPARAVARRSESRLAAGSIEVNGEIRRHTLSGAMTVDAVLSHLGISAEAVRSVHISGGEKDIEIQKSGTGFGASSVDLFHRGLRIVTRSENREASLAEAIKEINQWKAGNRDFMMTRSLTNPFRTNFLIALKDIFDKHNLHLLPPGQRLQYVDAAFDPQSFPKVHAAVHSILKRIIYSSDRTAGALSHDQYYHMAQMLSDIEKDHTFNENRLIRAAFNRIFDFWDKEKRLLELSHLVHEIEIELEQPGAGNLPQVAAMQDLHGGSQRAASLTGFVFGLSANVYQDLKGFSGHALVERLQLLLRQQGISAENAPLRIIGLADKYDRGDDPEGVFELVKWLDEERKAKPFMGNHDLWRLIAVLGVQHFFAQTGLDFKGPGIEGDHLAHWAREAFEHTGWGDIELDQINQKRFNKSLIPINELLVDLNLEPLDPIDLAGLRAQFEKELKQKKAHNALVRTSLQAKDGKYSEKDYAELPDIFSQTLAATRRLLSTYNTRIGDINAQYGKDIPLVSFSEVNLENFWQDPDVIDRALWELRNGRLFHIDVLGSLHNHNILPVDYTEGGFDVTYQGQRGIPALELMEEDIITFGENRATLASNSQAFREMMWSRIGEALTVINSWYSDINPVAKAPAVKEFVDGGGLATLSHGILGNPTRLWAEREARFLVFWGHNEHKKFQDPRVALPWIILYPKEGTGLVNIDYEMSRGYSDQGAIVTLMKRDETGAITGLRRWGYRKGSSVVEDLTFDDLQGMGPEQREFLDKLADGKSFLRWYREKALYQMMSDLTRLSTQALQQERTDKIQYFEGIADSVTARLSDPAKEAPAIFDEESTQQPKFVELAKRAKDQGWITEASFANIKIWSGSEYRRAHTELTEIFRAAGASAEAWKKIDNAWYTKAAPGTAGIRGTRRLGANGINDYTLGLFHLAHALAVADPAFDAIVKKQDPQFDPSKETKAVALGGDSRVGSYDPLIPSEEEPLTAVQPEKPGHFMKLEALINVALGTRVYMYRTPTSTPQLSWTIHQLDVSQQDAGVRLVSGSMSTASHNPSADNGNKPYKPDGSQSTGEFADLLSSKLQMPDLLARLDQLEYVSTDGHRFNLLDNLDAAFTAAVQDGRIKWIGGDNDPYDADEQFVQAELQEAIHTVDKLFNEKVLDLKSSKIVISPLYGVSRRILEKILLARGLRADQIVWVQDVPDPRFPGVKGGKPNPETPEAREHALKVAAEKNADLVLWTDPDSDRPAVAAKIDIHKQDPQPSDYISLNGNQQLAALAFYLVDQLRKTVGSQTSSDSALAKLSGEVYPKLRLSMAASTVVSGDLMKIILRNEEIQVAETLTGFKYIGDQIEKQIKEIQAKAGISERAWRKLSKQEKITLALKYGKLFLMGGEESLGALTSDGPHDKDAISGVMWFVEILGILRREGISLAQYLDTIYKTYGYFVEKFPMPTKGVKYGDVTLSEAEAMDVIKSDEGDSILNFFRKTPPQAIAGKKVLAVLDYRSQNAFDVEGHLLFTADSHSGLITQRSFGGKSTEAQKRFKESLLKIPVPENAVIAGNVKHRLRGVYSFSHSKSEPLPKENFIKILLEDGSWIAVRPSGTEPVVKFYVNGRGLFENKDAVDQWVDQASLVLDQLGNDVAKKRFPERFVRAENRIAEQFLELLKKVEAEKSFKEKAAAFLARLAAAFNLKDMLWSGGENALALAQMAQPLNADEILSADFSGFLVDKQGDIWLVTQPSTDHDSRNGKRQILVKSSKRTTLFTQNHQGLFGGFIGAMAGDVMGAVTGYLAGKHLRSRAPIAVQENFFTAVRWKSPAEFEKYLRNGQFVSVISRKKLEVLTYGDFSGILRDDLRAVMADMKGWREAQTAENIQRSISLGDDFGLIASDDDGGWGVEIHNRLHGNLYLRGAKSARGFTLKLNGIDVELPYNPLLSLSYDRTPTRIVMQFPDALRATFQQVGIQFQIDGGSNSGTGPLGWKIEFVQPRSERRPGFEKIDEFLKSNPILPNLGTRLSQGIGDSSADVAYGPDTAQAIEEAIASQQPFHLRLKFIRGTNYGIVIAPGVGIFVPKESGGRVIESILKENKDLIGARGIDTAADGWMNGLEVHAIAEGSQTVEIYNGQPAFGLTPIAGGQTISVIRRPEAERQLPSDLQRFAAAVDKLEQIWARSNPSPRVLIADKLEKTDGIFDLEKQGLIQIVRKDQIGKGKDSAWLIEAIRKEQPDVLLIRSDSKITAEVLEALKGSSRLYAPVVLRVGADTNNVMVKKAEEMGIVVARTHGNQNSVANVMLRFLFSFQSQIYPGDFTSTTDFSDVPVINHFMDVPLYQMGKAIVEASQKGRGTLPDAQQSELFSSRTFSGSPKTTFQNTRLALVGFGVIPNVIGEKMTALAAAVNASLPPIMVWTRTVEDPAQGGKGAPAIQAAGFTPGKKAKILNEANVISLHLPGSAQTFLDAAALKVLEARRDGPIAIINTARLKNVDHDALLAAMKAKKDLYYFADIDLTAEGQDIPSLKALREAFPGRAFLVPHIAASTSDAGFQTEINTVNSLRQIAAVFAGETTYSSAKLDFVVAPRAEQRDISSLYRSQGRTIRSESRGSWFRSLIQLIWKTPEVNPVPIVPEERLELEKQLERQGIALSQVNWDSVSSDIYAQIRVLLSNNQSFTVGFTPYAGHQEQDPNIPKGPYDGGIPPTNFSGTYNPNPPMVTIVDQEQVLSIIPGPRFVKWIHLAIQGSYQQVKSFDGSLDTYEINRDLGWVVDGGQEYQALLESLAEQYPTSASQNPFEPSYSVSMVTIDTQRLPEGLMPSRAEVRPELNSTGRNVQAIVDLLISAFDQALMPSDVMLRAIVFSLPAILHFSKHQVEDAAAASIIGAVAKATASEVEFREFTEAILQELDHMASEGKETKVFTAYVLVHGIPALAGKDKKFGLEFLRKLAAAPIEWSLLSYPTNLPALVSAAEEYTAQGKAYEIHVKPERGHWETPVGTHHNPFTRENEREPDYWVIDERQEVSVVAGVNRPESRANVNKLLIADGPERISYQISGLGYEESYSLKEALALIRLDLNMQMPSTFISINGIEVPAGAVARTTVSNADILTLQFYSSPVKASISQVTMAEVLPPFLKKAEAIREKIGLDIEAGVSYPNSEFTQIVTKAFNEGLPAIMDVIGSSIDHQSQGVIVPPPIAGFVQSQLRKIVTDLEKAAPEWRKLPGASSKWPQLLFAVQDIEALIAEIRHDDRVLRRFEARPVKKKESGTVKSQQSQFDKDAEIRLRISLLREQQRTLEGRIRLSYSFLHERKAAMNAPAYARETRTDGWSYVKNPVDLPREYYEEEIKRIEAKIDEAKRQHAETTREIDSLEKSLKRSEAREAVGISRRNLLKSTVVGGIAAAMFPAKVSGQSARKISAANPNALPATQQILQYLTTLAKGKPISGQNIGHPRKDFAKVYQELIGDLQKPTGERIGIAGADYGQLAEKPASVALSLINQSLIDHWKQGGLVTISWHARNPWTDGNSRDKTVKGNFRDLVTSGTQANKKWTKQLDEVALALGELQSAGVTVLWRPFHESNGKSFWWSQPQSPADITALWKHMFDYLTQTKKLNNLLWVYSVVPQKDAKIRAEDAHYPGAEYVDVVGLDAYMPRLNDEVKRGYERLLKLEKTIALTEFGPFGGSEAKENPELEKPHYDYAQIFSQAEGEFPEFAYILAWHGSWALAKQKNSAGALKKSVNVGGMPFGQRSEVRPARAEVVSSVAKARYEQGELESHHESRELTPEVEAVYRHVAESTLPIVWSREEVQRALNLLKDRDGKVTNVGRQRLRSLLLSNLGEYKSLVASNAGKSVHLVLPVDMKTPVQEMKFLVAALSDQGDSIHLLLQGQGVTPREASAYEAKLRQQIAELGLGDQTKQIQVVAAGSSQEVLRQSRRFVGDRSLAGARGIADQDSRLLNEIGQITNGLRMLIPEELDDTVAAFLAMAFLRDDAKSATPGVMSVKAWMEQKGINSASLTESVHRAMLAFEQTAAAA